MSTGGDASKPVSRSAQGGRFGRDTDGPSNLHERTSLTDRVQRFAGGLALWAARRPRWVIIASWALAVVAAIAASRLTVQAEFSRLLPPNALAVRHLRELERRTRVLADYLVGIEADDPKSRTAAAHALRDRLESTDPRLVSAVIADQRGLREFIWKNRYLYAPLSDLVTARDALQKQIDEANPFSLHLDEPSEGPPPSNERDPSSPDNPLPKLEADLEKAKKEAADPGEFVSPDGRLQRITVRTTFTADDTARGAKLTPLIEQAVAATRREFPNVRIGISGDVTRTEAEHGVLLRGVAMSVVVTVVLVLGTLLLFYRSVLGVGALFWSLTTAVLTTFAVTWFAIGHLNLASAFLSSIVIGNGINFGLMFLARYFEERQRNHAVVPALEAAAAGTAPGTLTAALTASIAYGSLAITPFRGYRDFGIIGSVGILLCWISAYTVLPAALALVGGRVHGSTPRGGSAWLEAILPRRRSVVSATAIALFAMTSAATVWYVTHDPFEDDLRNVTTRSSEVDETTRWMAKFDQAFGIGLSGGFAIAVRDRREAPMVAAKLRSADAGKPPEQHLFSQIATIDDLLPADQPEKLRVLADIRRLLDSGAVRRLPPKEHRRLRDLRPPDDLRPLTEADLPSDVALPFTERDGTRGRLILANTGPGVDTWRVGSFEHFAQTVRALQFPPDVIVGGTAFVFSDMLFMMKRDGPRATLVALVGSVVVVLALLGRGRPAAVALACAALGTLGMLTVAWLAGIKVNFLDFVALPITIGIGVDYAVNIAARAQQSRGQDGGRQAILATGLVVMLCSYTTVVGYASLLFSQNLGIRSFGLTAMIGELTCLSAAVLLGPALLDRNR